MSKPERCIHDQAIGLLDDIKVSRDRDAPDMIRLTISVKGNPIPMHAHIRESRAASLGQRLVCMTIHADTPSATVETPDHGDPLGR